VAVGQTRRDQAFADGRLCAVIVQNGSNKPRPPPSIPTTATRSPPRRGGRLIPAAEAPIDTAQGAAFSSDAGRSWQQHVERNVQVFRWDGATLADTGQVIAVKGGSAAMRTAGP